MQTGLRAALGGAAGLVLAGAAWLAFWPVAAEPEVWSPAPDPGRPTLRTLPRATVSSAGPDEGPEDVEVDAQGRVYGGTRGGRIWRWDHPDAAPTVFAETGGRPLGLTWGPAGALLVADAFRGLLSVAPDGVVTTLTTVCSGVPLVFTDDLEVAPDGRVWFTDASQRFDQLSWKVDLIENVPSGRLCVWDPATGDATAVLEGLAFANGVAMDPAGRFVLVAETARYRVRRYWIEGPQAGRDEIFVDGLPGFPDGCSQGDGGRFWVAIASPRDPLVDRLAPHPFLRKVVLRLPTWVQPTPARYAQVLAFDEHGALLADLVDPAGTEFSTITTVEERAGSLWFGSLLGHTWARVPY
jgi:sugar lactone lactonase YvrE